MVLLLRHYNHDGPHSMISLLASYFLIGSWAETVGGRPPKFEGGDPCIRGPLIFGEVVLLEACESSKRKKGIKEKLF